MTTGPQTRIEGDVNGLVQGDHNTVTLIFGGGRERRIPFLAPPKPGYDLVGRESLLAVLKERLTGGQDMAIGALNGLPGVGKTALAIATAHDTEVLAHFQDGVLWAALGRGPDVIARLASWARALEVSPDGLGDAADPREWAEAIHAAIGLRTMLLVVDDAWDAESALAFRLGGPNCSHLLTTRIPDVAAAFAVGGVTPVTELGEEDSLALLARIAPEVAALDPGAVRDLVKVTGGLPLALTLIGGHLRRSGAAGRSRRVRQAIEQVATARGRLELTQPEPLVGRPAGLPLGTSRSLLAVIEISYDALSPRGKQALLGLAAFPPKPNTFTEEAALAVAAADEDDLDELFTQGILEGSGADRCTLHQTISDYAREREFPSVARERLVTYYAEFVEHHARDYPELEQDLANILEALALAQDLGRYGEQRRMVVGLFPFLERRGLYELAENHLRPALDNTDGQAERGELLYCLGKTVEHRGSLELAEECLRESRALLAEAAPDSPRRADALVGLGWVVGMRGRLAEAADYFHASEEVARESGSRHSEASALQGLGWSLGVRGDYTGSISSLERAAVIARDLGDDDLSADILQVLGWMHNMAGNVAGAARSFQECLTIARRSGRPDRLIDALQGMGVVEMRECRYRSSATYLREAADIAERVGHRERMAILANLGAVHRELGDLDEARALLSSGLDLARKTGHQEKICLLLLFLGDVERRLGDFEAAQRLLDEGTATAREFGIHERLVEALGFLARLAHATGDAAAAEAYVAEGLRLTADPSDAAYRAILLIAGAEVQLTLGQPAEASASFSSAARIAEQAGRRELAAAAEFGLARTAEAAGDAASAERLGRQCLAVLTEITHGDAAAVTAWLASR